MLRTAQCVVASVDEEGAGNEPHRDVCIKCGRLRRTLKHNPAPGIAAFLSSGPASRGNVGSRTSIYCSKRDNMASFATYIHTAHSLPLGLSHRG